MGWRLGELIAQHRVPGAQVALLSCGNVHAEAAGVLSARTRVEVTDDSLFKVGSITKLWTATLTQYLVDDGLLDLDAPVSDHLPGFPPTLTARHLLTHTGGIEANHFFDTGRNDDAIGRYADAIAAAGQRVAPGTGFTYSNSGFVVLGRLVEVVGGQAFHDALKERLIRPLQIDEVATDADEAIAHRTAFGHVEDGTPVANWAVAYGTAPSGSHFSISARQLMEFVRLHLDDPGLAAMRADQGVVVPDLGTGAVGWGLGWMRFRDGVGHTGVSKGQKAFLHVDAERRAVAVLTNSVNGEPLAHDLITRLMRSVTP
ncbi:serine hydrolase domain-containing protein [Lentzea sp. CA-135723]|uniref:serine hydrolase domain-containing protein n=1 Tax=Lentzea sp. CA-135723 TaxID=3239950 RepID=UPI003D9186C7